MSNAINALITEQAPHILNQITTMGKIVLFYMKTPILINEFKVLAISWELSKIAMKVQFCHYLDQVS